MKSEEKGTGLHISGAGINPAGLGKQSKKLVKGSVEAKNHMAKLREMRKKK